MEDGDKSQDGRRTAETRLSRRRLLALTSASIAGAAGCANDGEDTDTDTGTPSPTTGTTTGTTGAATGTTTGMPTGTATGTPTETATGTPTETQMRVDDPDARGVADGYADREARFMDWALVDAAPHAFDNIYAGDHQKYIFPPMISVLDAGPDHEDVSQDLYDQAVDELNNGGFGGAYGKDVLWRDQFFHFSVVNLTRLVCGFPDQFEDGNREETLQNALNSTIQNPSGTQNHKTMEFTSGYLLAQEAEKAGVGGSNLKSQREADIRDYVTKLYNHGQGEWDSRIYWPYHFNAFLNVADFADDEEIRKLGRAAVDWYVTTFALKYTNGEYGGPHQRGGISLTQNGNAELSDAQIIAWLYFGGVEPEEMGLREAAHAIHTDYQPPVGAVKLAHKEVEQPFTSYASKPNYFMNSHNAAKTTFYSTPDYSLGTWYGWPSGWHIGKPENFMWHLVATRGEDQLPTSITAVSGGAANAQEKYTTSRGVFDQHAQYQNKIVTATYVPEDPSSVFSDTNGYSVPQHMMEVPRGYEVETSDGTAFFNLDGTYLAVHSITGSLTLGRSEDPSTPFAPGEVIRDVAELGSPAGFVIEVGGAYEYDSYGDFKSAVESDSSFSRDGDTVTYAGTGGDTFGVELRSTGGTGTVTVNGRRLKQDADWPVYQNPYVYQPVDGSLKTGELHVEAAGYAYSITVGDARSSGTASWSDDPNVPAFEPFETHFN